MKKVFVTVAALGSLAFATSAFAQSNMVGKWSWEGFTINCTEGGANGMSCKVESGPKNVGMEMIQSELMPKDGAFVGKIAHPMTGETYNAKMSPDGDDKFNMAGCTDGGTCAKGTFMRIK